MIVPWLPKTKIAKAADGVITAYQSVVCKPVNPPIPVEDIIERGLSLRLRYSNLREHLKLDDVLGATYVERKLICIDESLLQDRSDGRLCFTFAHETGHWILHREFINEACRIRSDDVFIFCRVKDAKLPVEWQADYFASCLLMPEETVKDAFHQCYGLKPLILYNVKSSFCGPICFDPCVENWPRIAAKVKKVGGFSNVSKQAMIIRLQDLGLVRNETRVRLSWAESYSIS
jgi:Zn-dependent peptidase ImmA (M78 family)